MPMYTFQLRRSDGGSTGFEAFQMTNDGETFAKAGQLLDEHGSCDHVEVWEADRAVLARYREQPVIRPIPA